ncbi:MAG: Spy/CpxP family protein refolding chaperone [Myxococcota bacterium]
MFGFVFGTVCLIGLMGVVRGHHRHHHDGWHHQRGWRAGRHGGFRRGHREGRGRADGSMFGRAAAEVIKRRLHVDEDQEGIVDHGLADVRAAVEEFGSVVAETRTELAGAFRGEAVDEATLAAVFARQDDELARARRDVVSALKQIHAVLDPEQRAEAADWFGAAEPRWV